MVIFFQEIVLLIIIWILRIIEGIIEIFNIIFGIDNLVYNSKEINIIDFLITDSKMINIFYSILLITVFLGAIFSIVSIIKNMISNNKNIQNIIGKYIISFLSTLIVLMIVLIVIAISNSFLVLLLDIFDYQLDVNISKLIFDCSVSHWFSSYSINEVDFLLDNVNNILGTYKLEPYSVWPIEWKYNGMLNPNAFMYLPALITSSIVLICLGYSCITITKRIYQILLLYLIMPLSLTTIALDDGIRFKYWQEQFIKEIVTSFSLLFAINIFSIIIPIISNMQFISTISKYGNLLLRHLMICGGAVFIPTSQKIINKIFFNQNPINIKMIFRNRKNIFGVQS